MLALAKRKGFSLINQLYFGEITVNSQSASLLAILDLSPDNVITCPKLKASLLRAKATEMQYAQKEALQKGIDSERHTKQGASRSPLLFFARNRVRHRRSETSTWGSAGNENLISSASASLQSRRNTGRSAGGGRSTSRSGGRRGGRNSGMSSGGQSLTRKDSNLLASRPFHKRSISSFQMAPRKSSVSSTISFRKESDASDSEGNVGSFQHCGQPSTLSYSAAIEIIKRRINVQSGLHQVFLDFKRRKQPQLFKTVNACDWLCFLPPFSTGRSVFQLVYQASTRLINVRLEKIAPQASLIKV